MTRTRRILLMTLAALALAFIAAEAWLRLQRAGQLREHADLEQTFRKAEAPGLVYERRPGADQTNAHGLRGPEWTCEKPDDVWRVLLVGDGIARGDGVPLQESLGMRLQEALNHERSPDSPRVEVLLVAETGYNTAQELALLEHEALACAPDVIVWVYALDDPAHILFHDRAQPMADHFHQPPSLALDGLRRLLFHARERIQASSGDAPWPRTLHAVYAEDIRANFQRLAALARQADVPVLLLVVPALETQKLARNPDYVLTPMDYEFLDLHTQVARYGLQQGLVVVEGLDAWMGKPLAELVQSPEEPWLPGTRGHELLALQLQKHMLRHGPYPGR